MWERWSPAECRSSYLYRSIDHRPTTMARRLCAASESNSTELTSTSCRISYRAARLTLTTCLSKPRATCCLTPNVLYTNITTRDDISLPNERATTISRERLIPVRCRKLTSIKRLTVALHAVNSLKGLTRVFNANRKPNNHRHFDYTVRDWIGWNTASRLPC